jgi:hypothetical protein
MTVFLWLDDIRNPFDNEWKDKIFATPPYQIVWVKNYQEFTTWIRDNGLPGAISFDHDLADEHYTPEEYWYDYEVSKAYQESQNYQEKTGYDCAKWLVDYCMDNNLALPSYGVHSFNPVGADNIYYYLLNYQNYTNGL